MTSRIHDIMSSGGSETNAICHRDYGNVADIQIKIFEGSLQIWSPGLLPFDVTVEDLLSPIHASSPRNKLIAQVFFGMGLIERYGGGIHRILDDCRAAGLPAPLFENSQGGFRIILKAGDADKSGAVTSSADEGGALKQQIIQLISDIPGMQRKTIVERTGVPERTVDRCIAECIAENKIERRGSKKTGGYWPLI